MLYKYAYLYYELLHLPYSQLKPKYTSFKFYFIYFLQSNAQPFKVLYTPFDSVVKICCMFSELWMTFWQVCLTVMNKRSSSNNNRMLSGYSQNKNFIILCLSNIFLNVDTACYEHSENIPK